jgi:hypothetical protein
VLSGSRLLAWLVVAALVPALLVVVAPAPVAACKLPATGAFEVELQGAPVGPLDHEVVARVRYYSASPVAPCALGALLIFEVRDLAGGPWGLLLTAPEGLPFEVPPTPIAIRDGGVAALGFAQRLGLWRPAIDGRVQVALVDADGRRTASTLVTIRADGALLWPGWLVAAGLLAVAGRVATRRRDRHQRTARP